MESCHHHYQHYHYGHDGTFAPYCTRHATRIDTTTSARMKNPTGAFYTLWNFSCPRNILNMILLLVIALFVGGSRGDDGSSSEVFTKCGGVLKEPQGVITTPDFPSPFPVPINCRWVIEAPAGKIITVYLTQFYLREGVRASEYAYFYDDSMHVDKRDLGAISFDDKTTFLVSSKPVLVLDLDVQEMGNIHMRVMDFFLDVFGFNITYEMMGKDEVVRSDVCSVFHCSFTGNCFATSQFESYYCSCFHGYFGDECQFGPHCNPDNNVNMCKNGGTCRYFIGSSVNTCDCPPGYEGVQCEKQKQVQLSTTDKMPAKCQQMGCTQSCILTGGGFYKCTCESGFYLDEDKVTCKTAGRARYLIAFKLYDSNVDILHLDTPRQKQLKVGIEHALLALLQPQLHQVKNLTVTNFLPGAVVQFQFFGEQRDKDLAKSVLVKTLKQGRIGKYTVDRNIVQFDVESAPGILKIEASETVSMMEGAELSLACTVLGSRNLKVQWYKDGALIDINNSYRSMWTTVLPKNTDEHYTALLIIEQAHVLDSGLFMCQVLDWGLTDNKTIQVTVLSAPKPTVTPLTATIREGDDLIITCFSRDDTHGSFGYNWLKNGEILNPSLEPEMIEDLFPTGSRVLITAAKSSATYTCIVTSAAGTTVKDCTVTVLSNTREIPTCSPQEYMSVSWSLTAADAKDIQRCPSGYVGDVKRRCNMKIEGGAVWEDPDFSGCLTSEFLSITRKFESLRLGYPLGTITSIIQELRIYLWERQHELLLAEGEPVVDLLGGMLTYLQDHTEHPEQVINSTEAFLDIASFLLNSSHLIQKKSVVSKLHQQVLGYGLLRSSVSKSDKFEHMERMNIVVETGLVDADGLQSLKFPVSRPTSRKDTSPFELHENDSVSSWLTDSVELDLKMLLVDKERANLSINTVVVFYKNLSMFLPQHFLLRQGGMDIEYQLHSRLLAVAVQSNHERLHSISSKVKVMAHLVHDKQLPKTHWNISCGVADLYNSMIGFTTEECHSAPSDNFTICVCNHLGTYAVLLTTDLRLVDLNQPNGVDMITAIGCLICVGLVFVTLFILIICWRHIRGAITALKIQVCLAVLGAFVTFTKALNSLNQEYYSHIVSLLKFFFLVAFCMQLCIGLIVYIEFVDLKSMHYPELKIAAIGWAVPMIIVGATLAAQVLEGFNLESWWLKVGTRYYYAYVISIVIISVLQVLLFLTVKMELNRRQKLDLLKQRVVRSRIGLLHRSLVILIALLLVSLSSILYTNSSDQAFRYFFAGSSLGLGLLLFLCYVVFSENRQQFCLTCRHEVEKDKDYIPGNRCRSNSCKSFIRPAITADHMGCVEEMTASYDLQKRTTRIHQLQTVIDRTCQLDWTGHEPYASRQRRPGSATNSSEICEFLDSSGRMLCDSASENGFEMFDDTPPVYRHSWRKRLDLIEHEHTQQFELQQLEGSPRSTHPPIRDFPPQEADYHSSDQVTTIPTTTHSDQSAVPVRLYGPSNVYHSDDSVSFESGDESEVSAFVPAANTSSSAAAHPPYRPGAMRPFGGTPITEEDDDAETVIMAAEPGQVDNHLVAAKNGKETSSIQSKTIRLAHAASPPTNCDDNGNSLGAADTQGESSAQTSSREQQQAVADYGAYLGPANVLSADVQEAADSSKKSWTVTSV